MTENQSEKANHFLSHTLGHRGYYKLLPSNGAHAGQLIAHLALYDPLESNESVSLNLCTC